MLHTDKEALKNWQEDLKKPDLAKQVEKHWQSICKSPTDISVFDSQEVLNDRITLKKIGKDEFILIQNVVVARIFQLANETWNYAFGDYIPSMNFVSKNMAINAVTAIVEMKVILTELFFNCPISSCTGVVKDADGNISGVSMGIQFLEP